MIEVIMSVQSALQGNPRPRKETPTQVTVYTGTVPVTTAKHYGSRLNSPHSKIIQNLELALACKKQKSDLESNYC